MTLSKDEFIKLEEELKLSDKRYRYKGEIISYRKVKMKTCIERLDMQGGGV